MMEVFVDDMITKSLKNNNHVQYLGETFSLLRRYNIKLNPKKYVFGVRPKKFLGFMVGEQKIEANP